ncbi:MAG TPA: PAS domain-containing protein, partial [Acetobacteraceae bacterium]|nr:PAS domain-containing protein [Acetobacteraceae bacterium]
MLPFSPEISEAWILSNDTALPDLQRLIREAGAAAENVRARKALYGRINAQLGPATRSAENDVAAPQARRTALTEGYLAAILANAPDALVAASSDGLIIGWNDAAARLFGKSWDEVAD